MIITAIGIGCEDFGTELARLLSHKHTVSAQFLANVLVSINFTYHRYTQPGESQWADAAAAVEADRLRAELATATKALDAARTETATSKSALAASNAEAASLRGEKASLLARIDARGYERSSQQLQFHNAFQIATSRILYKQDWALRRPDIVKKNGWGESFSEVLISTPRRFGKTRRAGLAPRQRAVAVLVQSRELPRDVVARPQAVGRELRGRRPRVQGRRLLAPEREDEGAVAGGRAPAVQRRDLVRADALPAQARAQAVARRAHAGSRMARDR